MEDSQLVCAYLDALDGAPRFHATALSSDWAYGRGEASARSLCDGVSVWVRGNASPRKRALAHGSCPRSCPQRAPRRCLRRPGGRAAMGGRPGYATSHPCGGARCCAQAGPRRLDAWARTACRLAPENVRAAVVAGNGLALGVRAVRCQVGSRRPQCVKSIATGALSENLGGITRRAAARPARARVAWPRAVHRLRRRHKNSTPPRLCRTLQRRLCADRKKQAP